jgi:hypothetical protein
VIADKTAREVLLADGVKPDFEPMSPVLNYIHRRDGAAEIYFVASRTNVRRARTCRLSGFRQSAGVVESGHGRAIVSGGV